MVRRFNSLQAVQMIVDMPATMTFDEVRHRLQTIDRNRAAAPSYDASMLLSLNRRHLQAVREGNQDVQDRLLNLIGELEWAFPDHAVELKTAFSGQHAGN